MFHQLIWLKCSKIEERVEDGTKYYFFHCTMVKLIINFPNKFLWKHDFSVSKGLPKYRYSPANWSWGGASVSSFLVLLFLSVLLCILHCKEQSSAAAVLFPCILEKMLVNEYEWRLLCFDTSWKEICVHAWVLARQDYLISHRLFTWESENSHAVPTQRTDRIWASDTIMTKWKVILFSCRKIEEAYFNWFVCCL